MTNNICSAENKRALIKLGLKISGPISAAMLSDILPTIIQTDNDYFLKMNKGKSGWGIWYETNRLGIQVNSDGELVEHHKYLLHTFRRDYNLVDAMASYLILLISSNNLSVENCNNRIKGLAQ